MIFYIKDFFYIQANAELDVNRDSLFTTYTDYFVDQGIIKRVYDFICNNDTDEQYAALTFIYSDLFNKTEEKYYDAYVCSNGNTLYYARWFYD